LSLLWILFFFLFPPFQNAVFPWEYQAKY
jgi:hypothetical protein